MSKEKWVKDLIAKQPVYDNKDAAIQAAIQSNKSSNVDEVWQEPKSRGGRFVVAAPEAFETLYREGYKRILDSGELADMERGEDTDEIEEV